MSGEVVNDVGSFLERPPKILVSGHVAAQKVNLGAARNVPFAGGRQVVEDNNPLHVEGRKGVHQICADGSCAASHQDGLPVESLGEIVQVRLSPRTVASSTLRSAERLPRE